MRQTCCRWELQHQDGRQDAAQCNIDRGCDRDRGRPRRSPVRGQCQRVQPTAPLEQKLTVLQHQLTSDESRMNGHEG